MGNTLLDLDFLPASDYKNIKSFEEQQAINQDHLRGLGEIYVRTKMHDSYGAGVLHRHDVPVREGFVMVHTRYDNDIDICKPENVRDSNCHNDIVHHSFFLNSKDQFQAYEYACGPPRPLPSTDFLYQLRSFLVENELTGVVAILAEDTHQDSVEFLLPDKQGMICVPRKAAYEGLDDTGSSVITGWKFYKDSDERIGWRERKECDSKPNGEHIMKDASTITVGA
jgi:hypothetical protein